jgi:hypothetical protein
MAMLTAKGLEAARPKNLRLSWENNLWRQVSDQGSVRTSRRDEWCARFRTPKPTQVL